MGRAPCCEKLGLKKGPWTPEEDQVLVSYIHHHGHGNWRALPKLAGLLRCGKSCRLRWINYLRPDIKRGNFSHEEEDTIIQLHEMLGNRWSAIAAKLPGRTDNEIKNVWHTHLKKKLKQNNEASRKLGSSSATTRSRPSNSGSTIPESEAPACRTMSPQPSSSEMASATETSMAVTGENNNSEVGSKHTDFSMESFPMIDESFWTDPTWSISSGESSSDISAFSSDTAQTQFPFSESSVDIDSGAFLWNDDRGPSMDNGMEFWYDLFMEAGGVEELPDF